MNQKSKTGRVLLQKELALVLALIPEGSISQWHVPEGARVLDMEDGGMGSIRFVKESHHRRAGSIAKAKYVDEDGVLVSIELNISEDNELFEVDFWKVDFSPLRRYPRPEDLIR